MENEFTPATLFKIYLALLALLAFTVGMSFIHFSADLSLAVSLFIAAIKAALVLAFFMNLKKSTPKIRFFAFAILVWTLVLVSLISVDYATRGSLGIFGK